MLPGAVGIVGIPAGGSDAVASGFGISAVDRSDAQLIDAPEQPLPSLLHIVVAVVACDWSRSAGTQVLTTNICPCPMSPPVAAASARTPTSFTYVSLIATVSGADVAVSLRFVRVTRRTWFAVSPCRHANTVASIGIAAVVSGVYAFSPTSRTLSPSFVCAKPISNVPLQGTAASAADIASQSTPTTPVPRRG